MHDKGGTSVAKGACMVKRWHVWLERWPLKQVVCVLECILVMKLFSMRDLIGAL